MKIKTTAKTIRNGGGVILKAGYCELQHLLTGVEPFAYTCGVYGWNFDAYFVEGVTVCTGYRNMCGRRYLDWETVQPFEAKAERICADWHKPWDEKQTELSALRHEFFEKVKEAARA